MEILERPRAVLEHQPEANHDDTLERDRMAAEQSTQTTPERWLPVPGYEGAYEVSDQGRVRSLARTIPIKNGTHRNVSGRVLAPLTDSSGYKTVGLRKSGRGTTRRVHSLVMDVFVHPRRDGEVVCHNNGDPADNRLTNLRYGTNSENMRDKRRHGTDYNVNKTHCPRGHSLELFNCEPYQLKLGRRSCKSCCRARQRIQERKDLVGRMQEVSDFYYRRFSGEVVNEDS